VKYTLQAIIQLASRLIISDRAFLRSVGPNAARSLRLMGPLASTSALYTTRRVCGALPARERERDGPPQRIVLDFDGTDDPAHGQQEGGDYHGYYRQHMYQPLLAPRFQSFRRASLGPPGRFPS
jgi:hypothetical protein